MRQDGDGQPGTADKAVVLPSPGEPAPAALALRNRMLGALMNGPEARDGTLHLVRCDRRAAVLLVEPRTQVLVLTRPDDPGEAFGRWLSSLVSAQPTGVLHLLLVGGGESDGEAFAKLAAEAPDPRGLGLHHLPAEGKLRHLGGRSLAALEGAGNRLAQVEPLSEDELSRIVAASHRSHSEAAHFASRVSRRFPLVSAAIGLVCVAQHLTSEFAPAAIFGQPFRLSGVNVGERVLAGEWWRLLASAFLHGSLTHLLMNMLVLYFVGTFLEQVIGRHRFLLTYGVAALAGASASAFLAPQTASVGASGALWGVMTAGFGISLWPRGLVPGMVAQRLKRGLMTPLVINLALSFLPGIDYRAHLGGGVIGLLFALTGLAGNDGRNVFRPPVPGPDVPTTETRAPTPTAIKVAAIAITGLMLISLLATYRAGVQVRLEMLLNSPD